jgi:hypothetical protein
MYAAFFVMALTTWNPIPFIILIGLVFSLVPSAIWPCVPLIIDERGVGAAFGLLSSLINSSLVIMYYVQGMRLFILLFLSLSVLY